jgi:hypothetical protein
VAYNFQTGNNKIKLLTEYEGVRCTRSIDVWEKIWVERDGPIPWPPSSPDITPLDFFL